MMHGKKNIKLCHNDVSLTYQSENQTL